MNNGPLLFLGTLFALAMSFWGAILAPHLQIGRQQSQLAEATGQQYPVNRVGGAQVGADVYRANGCVECHTQQVRPPEMGADLGRNWGLRRSVAQDYLFDYPVLLGELRWGPDLANVGARRTNGLWHLQHFYNPETTSPGSKMPPYRFLFEKRPLAPGQQPSRDAIISQEGSDKGGFEVVPKPEALALRDYMLSLRVETGLTEAPLPPVPTNQVPVNIDTNAPAATNALPATDAPPATPAPVPGQ